MNHRFFEKSDYDTVKEWWLHHKWEPVNPRYLSSLGLIVSDAGCDVCAGWLYVCGSEIAWVEWVVTNPKSPMKARPRAIKYLLDVLCNEAKAMQCSVVFTSLARASMIRLYEQTGFKKTDTNVTHLWRFL